MQRKTTEEIREMSNKSIQEYLGEIMGIDQAPVGIRKWDYVAGFVHAALDSKAEIDRNAQLLQAITSAVNDPTFGDQVIELASGENWNNLRRELRGVVNRSKEAMNAAFDRTFTPRGEGDDDALLHLVTSTLRPNGQIELVDGEEPPPDQG